ncbi:hypothetical protein ABZP36_006056 [Zizania latifolia]
MMRTLLDLLPRVFRGDPTASSGSGETGDEDDAVKPTLAFHRPVGLPSPCAVPSASPASLRPAGLASPLVDREAAGVRRGSARPAGRHEAGGRLARSHRITSEDTWQKIEEGPHRTAMVSLQLPA